MAGEAHEDYGAQRRGAVERDLGEVGGAGAAGLFDEGFGDAADLAVQVAGERRVAGGAQPGGAVLHDAGGDLRHARRRRPRPRAVRKNVQEGEVRGFDERDGVLERCVGLGGEAGDEVGAEGSVGPRAAHSLDQRQRIGRRVAAFHALQDEVVAGLQRQVQVRAEPRLASQPGQQGRVDLGGVDRGEPQARQLGDFVEDAAHQFAQLRRAGQVRAPAGEVDAGQHHLGIAGAGEAAHFVHHPLGGDRARVPAPERDDAEGAAVVAAILDFDIGAGAAPHLTSPQLFGWGEGY